MSLHRGTLARFWPAETTRAEHIISKVGERKQPALGGEFRGGSRRTFCWSRWGRDLRLLGVLLHYWNLFAELIRTPFLHLEMIWGIVPLYFGLLLNEMTPGKANFRTAIQTGFSFLWAGAQWIYPYLKFHGITDVKLNAVSPVTLAVTSLVLGFGAMAFSCGLLKRFPRGFSFLGHTRFANYFMIAIFPMQSPIRDFQLAWTWDRLMTIGLFSVPIWLLLHYGLMPIRGAKR